MPHNRGGGGLRAVPSHVLRIDLDGLIPELGFGDGLQALRPLREVAAHDAVIAHPGRTQDTVGQMRLARASARADRSTSAAGRRAQHVLCRAHEVDSRTVAPGIGFDGLKVRRATQPAAWAWGQ